jgi:M6 family metalloprotease-like protein
MNLLLSFFRKRASHSRLPWAAILLLCLPLMAQAQSKVDVKLDQAQFQGLTRISVHSNVPLTGITAPDLTIRRADGSLVPASDVLDLTVNRNELLVSISPSVFARTDSRGTTVATRGFGKFRAAPALAVDKSGEPASNGYLIGTSGWTDEGWNTIVSDPAFVDLNTGQHGLYRFSDITPDRDDREHPIARNGAGLALPAHRDKSVLVLFVEFPDRKASSADAPYGKFGPYLNFLRPATDWFRTSSYGQLQYKLVAPQQSRNLDWLMMGKDARDYKWGGDPDGIGHMFEYCHEAAQLAYDRYGIRVDAYDQVLIVPPQGKSGLPNGPASINDQYMGEAEVPSRTVLVDHDGKAHTIDTFTTAGNDLFIWGYRWLIHETGHTFGLPDLYMYKPQINGNEVDRFFYVGGWDMMGSINGQSTDFLAWHKWKFHWIRDDQVDVISHAGEQPSRHTISPVETPGGSKMVVIRTGFSTAYVAEFRTTLGVNGFDQRAKQAGVLLYKVDSTFAENADKPLLQVISKQYYNNPAVGGERNLTGMWRPIDKSLDGYEKGTTWQPGDVFSDPATGVTIKIDRIGRYTDVTQTDAREFTEEDTATLSVTKRIDVPMERKMALTNAVLSKLDQLHFTVNVEQSQDEPNWFVKQRTRLSAADVMLKRADGRPIAADRIKSFTLKDHEVNIVLKPGTFSKAAEANGMQLATKPYFNVGASASIPVRIER